MVAMLPNGSVVSLAGEDEEDENEIVTVVVTRTALLSPRRRFNCVSIFI